MWPNDSAVELRCVVHLSFVLLPPLLHSRVLSIFLFLTQTLRRDLGDDLPPPLPKRHLISGSPTTPLSTIEHLVLVDVLVAPHPRVPTTPTEPGFSTSSSARRHAPARQASLRLPRTASAFPLARYNRYLSELYEI
jgi:hypothetical protein